MSDENGQAANKGAKKPAAKAKTAAKKPAAKRKAAPKAASSKAASSKATSKAAASKAAPKAASSKAASSKATSKAAASKAAPQVAASEAAPQAAASEAAPQAAASEAAPQAAASEAAPQAAASEAAPQAAASEAAPQAAASEATPKAAAKSTASEDFLPVDKKPVEKTTVNGDIEMAYQDYGNPDNPAALLIMGLGCQLVHWPDSVVRQLLDKGYRVIRFDNRDAGSSAHTPPPKWPFQIPMVVRMLLASRGIRLKPPYTLSHMATDTIGLLDALKISKAHIVGVSMGGMIAQACAIEYPHRLLSMTSIMSSSGDSKLPPPNPEVARALLGRVPTNREEAIEAGVEMWRILSESRFPQDKDESAFMTALAYDKDPGRDGMMQQLKAILGSDPRTEGLASVRAPSLVVHGTADRLVPPECGEHTAECISGAKLEMIEGMGHALQPGVVAELMPVLLRHLDSVD